MSADVVGAMKASMPQLCRHNDPSQCDAECDRKGVEFEKWVRQTLLPQQRRFAWIVRPLLGRLIFLAVKLSPRGQELRTMCRLQPVYRFIVFRRVGR